MFDVFKVLDYGIFLKLDTADGYQLQLGRMLKIFILLGCSEYAECTAMHMNTLAYMKIHDTPTWRLIVNHFNCHNEELGEMSFSVLSRAMLGDNHKHKLDHMNEMHKLTALYRNVCGEITRGYVWGNRRKPWGNHEETTGFPMASRSKVGFQ